MGKRKKVMSMTSEDLTRAGKKNPAIDSESFILSVYDESKLAKIEDVKNYDPSVLDDKVLRDDFRIVLAWYSTWKKSPRAFKYDRSQLVSLLAKILEESKRRGVDFIKFNPSSMTPDSRSFFEEVAAKVGIYPEQIRKQIKSSDNLFLYMPIPEPIQIELECIGREVAESCELKVEECDHITLMFAPSESLQEDFDFAGYIQELKQSISGKLPIEGELQGYAYFDRAMKDGVQKTALVVLANLAKAQGLFEEAKNLLSEKISSEFEAKYNFVPHITLGYLPLGERVEVGKLPLLNRKIVVENVALNYKGRFEIMKSESVITYDFSNLTIDDLLKKHFELHLEFRQAKKIVTEDLVNQHAVIVEELLGRGVKHPAPPDDGLDDLSKTFEVHFEEQPDWTVPVKKSYQTVQHSGVVQGDEINLKDVLDHFKTFKLRKPYVYLVGGLANHGGKTKGDIDILVKDSPYLPEDFKHALHFRLGRALPSDMASRLQIHYDEFHGPFTNFVELYDLTFERVNPKNEVKEMSRKEDFFMDDFSDMELREKLYSGELDIGELEE